MCWGDDNRGSVTTTDEGAGAMERPSAQLEDRLVQWGKDDGGGRYGIDTRGDPDCGITYGPSSLHSLIKWHGRPPDHLRAAPTSTPSDEVEAAVRALQAQPDGFWPAQVIRLEYGLPAQPRESKRQKLARIGARMSDVRYCQHLRIARVHVAGWLRMSLETHRLLEHLTSGVRC